MEKNQRYSVLWRAPLSLDDPPISGITDLSFLDRICFSTSEFTKLSNTATLSSGTQNDVSAPSTDNQQGQNLPAITINDILSGLVTP
jgi:hypothetical protein